MRTAWVWLVAGVVVPACASRGAESSSAAQADESRPVITVPLAACNPIVYSAAVDIGAQSFQLILDTGSTTLGVAGAGCSSCSEANVPTLYQPGPTATDTHAPASSQFGGVAASGFTGEIFEDTVSVGSGSASASVRLVDIQQQNQFFVGACPAAATPAQGVLGLAPAANALDGTTGFFDQLIAGGALADVFAVGLCEGSGSLWLGGFDPAFATTAPTYTPMTTTPSSAFYTVTMTAMRVGKTTVPVPDPGSPDTILDTGSSITWIPPAAFASLTTAITSDPAFASIFGASASSFFADPNKCVPLTQTKDELDAALPPLDALFGAGSDVTMHAPATESYLLTFGDGQWCPALTSRTPDANMAGISASLGAPILRSNLVVFDRAQKRVGFAPHKPCR